MAAERKLEARLESRAFGFSKVLHLRTRVLANLLVDPIRSAGTTDAWSTVSSSNNTTDTRKLRRQYRGRGFDPASRISGRVREAARALVLPLVAWAGGIAWMTWGGAAAAAARTVFAHAALWSGAVLVVAAIARTPLGATRIAARRRLVEARRHFVRELR